MDIASLKYDLELANEGVWVNLDDHTQVKLSMASPSNRKYIVRLRQFAKEFVDAGNDETAEKIMAKVLAETVLLDWKGLTYNGKPVTYSPEEAEYLLLTVPYFRELITKEASDIKHFQR
jgi:hypothetical protein